MDQIRNNAVYAPDLQRGGNLWDDARQSRLIESLMLRIPLPLFYVAADKDENWSVVDGLQRITALRRFIMDESFQLQGLEFLVSLNGHKFSSLPSKFKNRINNTQLQFAVVGVNTPSEMQRNIFRRLNTGGLPLTPQEIRHALYYGSSAKLLKELAESESFVIATTDSVDDSRMAARELVLRFIAFLIRGWKDYPAGEDMDAYFSHLAGDDDLWVATFGDVARYVKERMGATVSSARKGGAITVSLDHPLDKSLFDLPLTLKTYVDPDWNAVRVTQGEAATTVEVVREDDKAYVLYQAVPGGEEIELTPQS